MPDSTSQKPRRRVIGLGSMGYGMATSLRVQVSTLRLRCFG